MNYEQANVSLGTRQSRKLANNTYLQRRDAGMIAIKLHDTDVVTFTPGGAIHLCTGGYHTSTTKDRIQTYAGIRISQRNGVWHTEHGILDRQAVIFADGRTEGFKQSSSDTDALRKQM